MSTNTVKITDIGLIWLRNSISHD